MLIGLNQLNYEHDGVEEDILKNRLVTNFLFEILNKKK